MVDRRGSAAGRCRALSDGPFLVHLDEPYLGFQNFTVPNSAELHAVVDILDLALVPIPAEEKILKAGTP